MFVTEYVQLVAPLSARRTCIVYKLIAMLPTNIRQSDTLNVCKNPDNDLLDSFSNCGRDF